MAAELLQAAFTPGQMIAFFLRCGLHALTHLRQFGCECLALVQRLCTHFAALVDAHQTCGMTAFVVAQVCGRRQVGRILRVRHCGTGHQCAQRLIGLQYQGINQVHDLVCSRAIARQPMSRR